MLSLVWSLITTQVVVFKYFAFSPLFGEDSILTNIFQIGWNHQPENAKPGRGHPQGHVAALRSAVTAAELVLTAHSHASHVFSTLECSKVFFWREKLVWSIQSCGISSHGLSWFCHWLRTTIELRTWLDFATDQGCNFGCNHRSILVPRQLGVWNVLGKVN